MTQLDARRNFLVIGLTGGIGTGKTTASQILQQFKFPVHSADAVVHRLLGKNGKAVKRVAQIFPKAHKGNVIDRQALALEVLGQPRKLRKLEVVLHPLVQRDERVFLKATRHSGAKAAILEIPLLFETGAEKRCDIVICMTVSRAIQKARVMKRAGMTAAKLKAILERQMPDAERQRRADYVIRSDRGRVFVRKQLQAILLKNALC